MGFSFHYSLLLIQLGIHFIDQPSNVPYMALGYEMVGEARIRKRFYIVEKIVECFGFLLAAGGPAIIIAYSQVNCL